MKTIVVTGVGGPAGRAIVEQLAASHDGEQLIVVGADMTAVELDGLAMCEQVPAAADPAYLPAMRELIGRVRADLVIPTVQDELVPISSTGALLGVDPAADLEGDEDAACGEGDWFVPPVVVSDPGPTAIAADKLLTMWALDEAGVPVPRYGAASEFVSTQHALDALGSTIVLKPRVSRGGRGVQVVDAADEVDWAAVDAGTIVQEFAPGVEYAPQVYRSPVDGRVVVVVLEKTELKEGRVGNAVSTRRLASGEAADVELLAERVVTALGLTGPIDMDVRRLANGTAVVLEVNARFGANSAQAPELLAHVLREYVAPDVQPGGCRAASESGTA